MKTAIFTVPNGETFTMPMPLKSQIINLMANPVTGRPTVCYTYPGIELTERQVRKFQWMHWEDDIKDKQSDFVYIGTIIAPQPGKDKVINILHLFEKIN